MTKSELVQRLRANNPHLYERDVETIINIIFGQITAALARDDRVELRGFGSFSTKHREARISRNPRTGAKVQVSEKRYPIFKTGKVLHARVNKAIARQHPVEPLRRASDGLLGWGHFAAGCGRCAWSGFVNAGNLPFSAEPYDAGLKRE